MASKIIAIEGINGAGKSTVAKQVTDRLASEGYKVMLGRLPGQTGIDSCEAIRSVLKNHIPKAQMAKFFLYLADMEEFYEHIRDFDGIVILDRSVLSTLVYETLSGIPIDKIITILGQTDIYTNHCLLLDCDPRVAFYRLSQRTSKTVGGYADRDLDFYRQLREGYLNRIRYFDYDTVDSTTGTIDENIEMSYRIIKGWIDD